MRNLLKKFRKFFNFPFAQKSLLLKTAAIIVVIKVGLKLLSFQRFRNFYGKLIADKNERTFSKQAVARYVRAIEAVGPALKAECLPQALALKYFLRGDKSIEVIIGVRQTVNFAAHAWVENRGEILLGELSGNDFQKIWSWH